MTQCKSRTQYKGVVFTCRLTAGHEQPTGEHYGLWHNGQEIDLARGRIVTLAWRPANIKRKQK